MATTQQRCQVRRKAGHKFVRSPPFFGPQRTAKPREPWLPRDKTLEEIQRCHASLPSAFALALTALSLSAGLSSAVAKPAVEVAFVLDTTGSMGGLLEGAKRKIWSIATAIVDSNPDADIRMGLVAYRDIGDDYVTKKFDLTTRHPGSLRQPAGTEGARRRRLAGKRQRGARCRRQQAAMDLWRRHQADRVPGRRRAAAHGLRAGHQISGHAVGGQAEGHHRQRGAGRRRPRYRAGVARHRPERQRPLHPDPAGRRPGRHHRNAL